MADQIRATPRSPILGLFSDLVNLPLQYMSSPERTQQMQGAAQFLYGTGIPKTLERASYGESLFSGAGGLGGTTRMRPETAEAAMNVAPFAPVAGRVAGRMIKATEGMPVGMGIKDVGKNIFEDATKYHQKVPEIKSINVAKLKRMNAGEVADVSDEVAAKMDFSEPIKVSVFADGELRIVDGHHRVAAAKKLGIQSLPVELQAINAKGSTLNKLAQEATYPQQAALDLAQQRAALPVEQGGLGLPVTNTAADRAKAMGFDTDLLHGTAKDFPAFDLSKAGTNTRQAGDELGIFSTSKPFLADDYAQIASKGGWANRTSPDNPVVYPLVGNFSNPKKYQTASQFYRDADAMAAEQNLGNWRKQLQGQGYDSVFVRPDLEEVVAFSPDQLRSRFAAFDPFRKDVATAAAMGVAAPNLLAQPVNQVQPTYETIPMYTDPFGNTIGSSIR
jgi:hypothetical protein